MSEKIEIVVRYSEKDYVRGMSYNRNHKQLGRVYKAFIFTSSALGGFFLYSFFIRSEGPWRLADGVALGVGALLLYLLSDFHPFVDRAFSKEYESMPLLQESYKIVFSEEGVLSTSDSFESDMKWSSFVETKETDDDFHFFTAPHASLFVPKRTFSSEQKVELRNLTKRMVGSRSGFLH